MRHHPLTAIAMIGLFVLHASGSSGQETSSAPGARTAAASSSSPAAPQNFQPGLDDLMTLLIVPRHIKLHAAGTARNWELAAFEVRELRSAFQRIVGMIPIYGDRNVDETIRGMIAPRLDATESAIAAGDVTRFTKAYEELTASCNACHTYLEHPFLVIKVPSAQAASAYPNQSFATP